MKDIFQFRLKNESGDYYYIDPAGAIATSATAKNLLKSVVDWNNIALHYIRNSTYLGVFRKQAPDTMRFAGDGLKILRYVFNANGGSEAVCSFEIMKLRSLDQQYYLFGTFDIDFSKYKRINHNLDVALMEGGLSARLAAYESTGYNIALTDPAIDAAMDYLWMDGILLKGSYNYQSQQDGPVLLDNIVDQQTIGIVYINQDGTYNVAVTNSVLGGIDVPGGSFSGAHILQPIQVIDGTLKLDLLLATLNALSGNTGDCRLQVWADVYDTSGWTAPISSVMLWDGVDLAAGTVVHGTPISSSVLFPDGWTYTYGQNTFLVVYYKMVHLTAGTNLMDVVLQHNATNITIDYTYIQPATACRALSHWKVFKNLHHQLTDSAIDPVSDLLSTFGSPWTDYILNPAMTFFTCGDALRQIYAGPDGTVSDPTMVITPKDFAKDAFVSLCAGVGIEKDISGNEVLRLERLQHFFQKDVLIKDLGYKITKWSIRPYTDHIGNNIAAGYGDQTYDEVNGRFETNVQTAYQTGVLRTQQDLDYTAPFRLDPYGAEYVRANLANKQTTDSSSDNDIFKIQARNAQYEGAGITPDPYLLDKNQVVTAGLPADVADTMFNMTFTPAREMGRMSPFLASNYYGLRDQILKYKNSTKNEDLICSVSTGPVVTESADIDLAEVEDLIWKPYVFEFIAEIPMDLADLMETNPYGVFGHHPVLEGKEYYLEGFVLDIGVLAAHKDTYAVKLLCSPNTEIPNDL